MSAAELAEILKREADIETRISVLGHIQRGGSPSARDRVIASQFGAKAVEVLKEGRGGIAIGMRNHEVVDYKLEDVFEQSDEFGYGDVQIVQGIVDLIIRSIRTIHY